MSVRQGAAAALIDTSSLVRQGVTRTLATGVKTVADIFEQKDYACNIQNLFYLLTYLCR